MIQNRGAVGEATHFFMINTVQLSGTAGIVLKQGTYSETQIGEACLTRITTEFIPLRLTVTIPKEDPGVRFPYILLEDQDPRFVIRFRSVIGAASYLAWQCYLRSHMLQRIC